MTESTGRCRVHSVLLWGASDNTSRLHWQSMSWTSIKIQISFWLDFQRQALLRQQMIRFSLGIRSRRGTLAPSLRTVLRYPSTLASSGSAASMTGESSSSIRMVRWARQIWSSHQRRHLSQWTWQGKCRVPTKTMIPMMLTLLWHRVGSSCMLRVCVSRYSMRSKSTIRMQRSITRTKLSREEVTLPMLKDPLMDTKSQGWRPCILWEYSKEIMHQCQEMPTKASLSNRWPSSSTRNLMLLP